MKKLFTIAALGLALSAPINSFANEGFSVFGVNLPIQKNGVNENLNSDYVYTNKSKTLNVFGVDVDRANKNVSTKIIHTNYDQNQDSDFIIVFGVKIPVSKS